MHPSLRHLLLSAAAFAALKTAAAQTTVLRNDDLSSMSNWFNSSASGMSLVNGGLSITAGRHALTYFTANGSFQTLGTNETLQVTFDLSFSQVGTSNGGFRLGLFDSNGGTRPTTNGVSSGFQGYDGYLFSWNPNPGSSSNALRLSARTPGSSAVDTLLSSTATGTYSVVGSGGGPSGQVFQTGTSYQATYTVSRGSGSGLDFEFSVTGGNLVNFSNAFSITSPSTYSFDAFAILSVSSSGSNFALDNFRVSHAVGSSSSGVSAFDLGGPTVIPEPSTYAAGAGLAALGLAVWRRRRKV
jgi:MYXO-CTERM domain-containing protein